MELVEFLHVNINVIDLFSYSCSLRLLGLAESSTPLKPVQWGLRVVSLTLIRRLNERE